jgi:uncharacterized protein YndB with AHSA1/START domain
MIATASGAGPAPASTAPDNREATATRVFDAPRELVWEVMTRPEHLVNWYGPRSTTLVSCEIDLRPGGAFRFVMRVPDGMPGHEALETATFEEEDGRTTVRLSILFPSVEDYTGWAGSGAFGGWAESLDRLAKRVAGLAAGRA